MPKEQEQHDTEVGTNLAGNSFRAYCKTCGWVGREYFTVTDAENDADEHVLGII